MVYTSIYEAGNYATKKATAPITIAIVRMIRSSLSSGNMTQDGGYLV